MCQNRSKSCPAACKYCSLSWGGELYSRVLLIHSIHLSSMFTFQRKWITHETEKQRNTHTNTKLISNRKWGRHCQMSFSCLKWPQYRLHWPGQNKKMLSQKRAPSIFITQKGNVKWADSWPGIILHAAAQRLHIDYQFNESSPSVFPTLRIPGMRGWELIPVSATHKELSA